MLSEAYELGIDDAVEYVEKVAVRMFGWKDKKKAESIMDRAKRHGRELKGKVVGAGESAGHHVMSHKGKYGTGAAAAAAAGGGYAYYKNRKK